MKCTILTTISLLIIVALFDEKAIGAEEVIKMTEELSDEELLKLGNL